MKTQMLKLHSKLILMFVTVIGLSLSLTITAGEVKPDLEIEWLDIIGEGGIVLMTLMWLFATLISRPAGQVTNWLIFGLTTLHLSVLLDFLDEFYRYTDSFAWLTTVESLPAPIGMILMSVGLYLWHKEQIAINDQLLGRERFYRQHSFTDSVTNLYSAEYMIQQIESELRDGSHSKGFSLLLLDLDNFDAFVRKHGDSQADRLLREVAELVLMNIRTTDLACRYAGDRFIVLLPETEINSAQLLAKQIQQAISHLAFKPEQSMQGFYHSISISVRESQNQDTVDSLLTKLNQDLEQIKLSRKGTQAA